MRASYDFNDLGIKNTRPFTSNLPKQAYQQLLAQKQQNNLQFFNLQAFGTGVRPVSRGLQPSFKTKRAQTSGKAMIKIINVRSQENVAHKEMRYQGYVQDVEQKLNKNKINDYLGEDQKQKEYGNFIQENNNNKNNNNKNNNNLQQNAIIRPKTSNGALMSGYNLRKGDFLNKKQLVEKEGGLQQKVGDLPKYNQNLKLEDCQGQKSNNKMIFEQILQDSVLNIEEDSLNFSKIEQSSARRKCSSVINQNNHDLDDSLHDLANILERAQSSKQQNKYQKQQQLKSEKMVEQDRKGFNNKEFDQYQREKFHFIFNQEQSKKNAMEILNKLKNQQSLQNNNLLEDYHDGNNNFNNQKVMNKQILLKQNKGDHSSENILADLKTQPLIDNFQFEDQLESHNQINLNRNQKSMNYFYQQSKIKKQQKNLFLNSQMNTIKLKFRSCSNISSQLSPQILQNNLINQTSPKNQKKIDFPIHLSIKGQQQFRRSSNNNLFTSNNESDVPMQPIAKQIQIAKQENNKIINNNINHELNNNNQNNNDLNNNNLNNNNLNNNNFVNSGNSNIKFKINNKKIADIKSSDFKTQNNSQKDNSDKADSNFKFDDWHLQNQL